MDQSRYIAKHVVNLPKSGIRDFFDIVAKMKDAISLGVGEPDFDTPWHIREAGIYALEKGVEGVVIKSGRFKDVGSPLRKMSDEERKLLQSVMDDVHQQFIQAVADGRSMELSDVEPLADGRIYTGRQAKEARLVDELGDLDDAIDGRIPPGRLGVDGDQG